MKAIPLILSACLGGFIAVAVVLPATRIEPLYTRAGVERLEQLRLKAAHGDISEAASTLKDTVEYWPPKLSHDGRMLHVYELARASVIREIIARMRELSGENLGEDPQLWIDKFYHKETLQPTRGDALGSPRSRGLFYVAVPARPDITGSTR